MPRRPSKRRAWICRCAPAGSAVSPWQDTKRLTRSICSLEQRSRRSTWRAASSPKGDSSTASRTIAPALAGTRSTCAQSAANRSGCAFGSSSGRITAITAGSSQAPGRGAASRPVSSASIRSAETQPSRSQRFCAARRVSSSSRKPNRAPNRYRRKMRRPSSSNRAPAGPLPAPVPGPGLPGHQRGPPIPPPGHTPLH